MTQEMIDELLKEQFLVIARVPWSTLRVGEIVTQDLLGSYKSKVNLSNYPHLFKRMKWFENRTPDQMPDFIKYTIKGEPVKYIKVDAHFTNRYGGHNIYGFMHANEFYSYEHSTPITEVEYLSAKG